MKSEEISHLKKQKTIEGKSDTEASLEITNLINSQKLFKESKKEIKKLNKIIERLKKKLEKKIKIKFLEGLGLKKEKEKLQVIKEHPRTLERVATILHLKRIMNLLKLSNPSTLNEICKDCGMKKSQAKSAILFLVNHQLIKKVDGKYVIHGGKNEYI